MTKLFERDQTRDTVQGLPETHRDLPELPHDVRVPDDISGIAPATVRRADTGVRWMRWLVVSMLLVAGAVVAALVMRSDDPETVVDDGYAVVEANRTDTLRDLAITRATGGTTTAEINRMNTMRYRAIGLATAGHTKAEINRMNTLRDLATVPAPDGYNTAELNRVNTLRDLAISRTTGGHTTAELNRVGVLEDLPG